MALGGGGPLRSPQLNETLCFSLGADLDTTPDQVSSATLRVDLRRGKNRWLVGGGKISTNTMEGLLKLPLKVYIYIYESYDICI